MVINKYIIEVASNIEKKPWIFLLVIIIANLILKAYNLSGASLFLDETSQIMMSFMDFQETIEYSLENPNAPVYTLLLNIWIKIFGISEVATRWLSVILSTAIIPILYFFCKRFFNHTCAIIAILFFSVSNLQMHYSHDVRSYALVSLLVTISFYLFLSILEKQNWKKLLWYTVVNSLLLYTHLTSVFVLPVQFIILLWFIKQKPRVFIQVTISQIISVVLLSFWFLSNTWFGGSETTWMAKPGIINFFEMYYFFFNKNLGSIIVLLTIIIFIILLIKNKKFKSINFNSGYKIYTVVLWAFLPVIIMFLLSVFYNPRFIPRYMLYTSIGAYIGFAYLLSLKTFPVWLRWILVTLFLVGSSARLDLNPSKGEEWKPAMEYYNKIKTPGTITIVSSWYQWMSFSYYYKPELFKNYKSTLYKLSTENISFANGIGVLDYYDTKDFDNLILILSHYKVADPEEVMLNDLLNMYPVTESKEFQGIRIFVFDIKNEINKE
ncbi:glycosyltransferase family 39 protein [Bacteroidota bacterium]